MATLNTLQPAPPRISLTTIADPVGVSGVTPIEELISAQIPTRPPVAPLADALVNFEAPGGRPPPPPTLSNTPTGGASSSSSKLLVVLGVGLAVYFLTRKG